MSRYPASARALNRAYRQGKGAKSSVFLSGCQLLCWGALWSKLGTFTWVRFRFLLECGVLSGVSYPAFALAAAAHALVDFLVSFVGTVVLVCVLARWGQNEFRTVTRSLAPSLAHCSPLSGIRQLFSALRRAPFLLLGVGLVATALSLCVLSMSGGVLGPLVSPGGSQALSAQGIAHAIAGAIRGVLLCGGAGLVLIGATQWLCARRSFLRSLEMSPEQARREHRDDEGDPQTRAQRRADHYALASEPLVHSVRRARVIVVERRGGC